MHPEKFQKFNDAKFSRRNVFALTTSAIISMALKDKEPSTLRKLRSYNADIFSHNADSITKIELSNGIPAIEMDVFQMDNGKLVVAHSLEEFNNLPLDQKLLMEPTKIAEKIRLQNAKPHIDIKHVTNTVTFTSFILSESKKSPLVVSGPNHEFLWNLHKNNFDGKILFTLKNSSSVKKFLNEYEPSKFKNGEFGVSINFTTLTNDVGKKLKERNLYILAWTPNTALGILSSLRNGANGITSDMPNLLKEIGKNKNSL